MTRTNNKLGTKTSNTNRPPPPGLDAGRSNDATRENSYRPPPRPFFDAFPPPHSIPPSSSRYDSYAPSFGNNNRDRDRDRGSDRVYERGRDDRCSRNDHSRRDDRYQPSYDDDNSYRPLPTRLQSPSYSSSNRDSRDSRGGDSFRPPQGDFTFRAEKPAGVGDSYRSYRPSDSGHPRNAPRGPARGPQHKPDRPSGARNLRAVPSSNGRRRLWKPFNPAERAIVQGVCNQAPAEDYADEENGVTYRAVDQLSDSDEADMDTSDSDNEPGEPIAKQARTAKQAANGDRAPRWCNPDPYDALPPVEDTDKKRKDMVQLIRKARVQGAMPRSFVHGDDEDFIRLDVDGDEEADGIEDQDTIIHPLMYTHREPKIDVKTGVNGAKDVLQTAPSAQLSRPQHVLPTKPGLVPPSGAGQVAPQALQATANGLEIKVPFIDLSRGDVLAAKKLATSAMDSNKKSEAKLGTHKRTADDVLKLPAHAIRFNFAGKKTPVGGLIHADWQPKRNENPSPWIKDSTFKAHLNVRLHMEVRDFYEHVKPCQFEDRLRGKLVSDLNETVTKITGMSNREMYPFGSYMSGLYLPTGDMDLAYCSRAYVNGGPRKAMTEQQQRNFIKLLRRHNIALHNRVEAVLKAKVPIAKYVDSTTGLRVDISFENIGGLKAISTFKAWREQFPAMPILVTVIKQFLLMRGLNEPVNGGIGGFSIICMVVSLLQMMPPVQSGNMVPEHNLGHLLMQFFDLYGNRFDYRTTALRMNPPGYVNKHHVREFTYRNANRISIIDPNNPANDISGGSSNYPQISACFRHAYECLQERLQRIASGEHSDSILEPILGGNYNSFREQREYLRKLHIKVYGHCDDQ